MAQMPMRVLVLSRNYPNNVMELLGLWVRGLTRQSTRFCSVNVVSPVPYCPPVPALPENFARFRAVDRRRRDGDIEVFYPRFVVGPSMSTHSIEWFLYLAAVRSTIDRLRRDFRFDLIHAHFTYPDGVVATHLGRRYGVPVVITEQNPWGPWMNQYASVRRRAITAARQSACLIAISQTVRRTIEQFTGSLPNVTVIPDGVDASEFTLRSDDSTIVRDQVLFAGAIRPVKGVDVLLRAIRSSADRGRRVNLILVGEAFFKTYRAEEQRLKQMAIELGIADRVSFVGKQPLPQLVRYMQESAALVLPSRAESLGMVLIEALACGTPVVATRCGGPEEIVTDPVGVLVAPEDPEAMARAIEHVLDRRDDYDSRTLRAHALQNFGMEAMGERLKQVYEDAVGRHRRAAAAGGSARHDLDLQSPVEIAGGRS